ncbi:hypothetical protein F7725_027222 [Dissostichus mawsoni]|uniref:PH domain-containing protein n=1 Tax=Dissostichus mawsoni TaxID=36200 RepID=A0A7J5XCD4_DISMA|nr:hypothetical protein F7725_027222 [Dissostichus mawsoni]
MASIMEGPLSKWTNVMKGWQYRWFVLDYNAGLLSYYTSKDKMMRGSRRGCVRLRGAVIGIDDEDDSTFTITVFTSPSPPSSLIRLFVSIHSSSPPLPSFSSVSTCHSPWASRPPTSSMPSPMSVFRSCMLWFYKGRLFDEKIKDCKEDESRRKIENLKETTCSMVESIKHCIVLLQIAKTLRCVDQTNGPPRSVPSGPSSGMASPSHMPLPSHSVPDFSYSSSEDEFYDADEFYQNTTSPKHCIDPSGSQAASNEALKRPDTTESLNSSMSNGTTDADQFENDDRDDEGEGESVEEHKSVIMHLLSQVRLGMDLTKVVLPTFILERRSLLEMYADFFAHPDLFEEARERMVQVVKWYMSAFHAGRKGSVAKKPYNPILGEVFYCHWDLPTETEEPPPPRRRRCPRVPCRGLPPTVCVFVAEQCLNRKIQFNAHIWTKSKFLGMSIGVHNIGQGTLIHPDYINGLHTLLSLLLSILTVPWVELGGECNISCSKSGFSANIVFHTKPFYGGKKHRITAEIFSPNDKKSFCSIEGEWNGVILWRDVTLNLKLKDIDSATEAKHSLEEKQRGEARERKENEQQWETRLFHEDGEVWVYDEPLLKRYNSQGGTETTHTHTHTHTDKTHTHTHTRQSLHKNSFAKNHFSQPWND